MYKIINSITKEERLIEKIESFVESLSIKNEDIKNWIDDCYQEAIKITDKYGNIKEEILYLPDFDYGTIFESHHNQFYWENFKKWYIAHIEKEIKRELDYRNKCTYSDWTIQKCSNLTNF